SNRWEPVDGYAVDMSGFGTEEDDPLGRSDGSGAWLGSGRMSLVAEDALCAVEEPRGERSGSWPRPRVPRQESGASIGSAGTPSSQDRRRRRGGTPENRAAAFQLTPQTLRHLERSEQAHEKAMATFLGEQGYARAKRQGAARLRLLPGAATSEGRSMSPEARSGNSLPGSSRRGSVRTGSPEAIP
ncbi:unnamed protein product, partial [Laminaria digitata]